jgi:Sulfotransferase family
MPLPSFLCIGAQKAGTTWLFEQLIGHPEVWMPPVKELHYFDHRHVEPNRKWTTNHIQKAALRLLQNHLAKAAAVDWAYIDYLADMAGRDLFTPQWYERCFDRPRARSRLCGDVTPEYCAIGEAGIAELQAMLPDVKVLFIARDPLQRALSQLRMNISRRKNPPNDAEIMRMCSEWDLHNRGDYAAYLPGWIHHMPAARLKIVPYGRIRTDPAAFMRELESFLGIAAFDGYKLDARVHETRKHPLPEAAVEYLTEQMAHQLQFLEKTFGREFVALTR